MKLTRERALELHRQMWTDMQKDLGDNPTFEQRHNYKARWVRTNFPHDCVACNCFLCEYAKVNYDECEEFCPIKWPSGRCEDGGLNDRLGDMLISKLLALPERGDEEIEEKIEEEPAEMKDGLYLCELEYNAEGRCYGYMYLTKQEYETVKKVVNTDNWSDVNDEGYAGSLSIYCKKLEEEKLGK